MKILPKARTTEIVENDLGKELLIYDLRTDKAYSLNETSKIIFKSCDGRRSFDELKRKYKFTDDLIHFALDELKRNDLLAGQNVYVSPFAGMSRRETIKKVGLASMIALPVISGLVAPTAADAASLSRIPVCVPNNYPCFSNASYYSRQPDADTCRRVAATGSECCSCQSSAYSYSNGLCLITCVA